MSPTSVSDKLCLKPFLLSEEISVIDRSKMDMIDSVNSVLRGINGNDHDSLGRFVPGCVTISANSIHRMASRAPPP